MKKVKQDWGWVEVKRCLQKKRVYRNSKKLGITEVTIIKFQKGAY